MGKEKVLMIYLIFQFLQTNYRKSRENMMENYKTPPQKLHIRYKNAKRKLEIASQMSKDSQNLVERTPVIR